MKHHYEIVKDEGPLKMWLEVEHLPSLDVTGIGKTFPREHLYYAPAMFFTRWVPSADRQIPGHWQR